MCNTQIDRAGLGKALNNLMKIDTAIYRQEHDNDTVLR